MRVWRLSSCRRLHRPPRVWPVADSHCSLDFGPVSGEVCRKTTASAVKTLPKRVGYQKVHNRVGRGSRRVQAICPIYIDRFVRRKFGNPPSPRSVSNRRLVARHSFFRGRPGRRKLTEWFLHDATAYTRKSGRSANAIAPAAMGVGTKLVRYSYISLD